MTEARDLEAEMRTLFEAASPAMREALIEFMEAFVRVADIQREEREAPQ